MQLAGAIAKVVMKARGVDPQFKAIVRHAREVHNILRRHCGGRAQGNENLSEAELPRLVTGDS